MSVLMEFECVAASVSDGERFPLSLMSTAPDLTNRMRASARETQV